MEREFSEKSYKPATFEFYQGEYASNSFAGYAQIDDTYAASAADFGILPKKNHYFGNVDKVKAKLDAILKGTCEPEFVIFQSQENIMAEILHDEIKRMAEVYQNLETTAIDVLRVHAPKSVEDQVKRVVIETIYFNTVGFIGACAVKSGALKLPEDDKPIAFYVYKYAKDDVSWVLA